MIELFNTHKTITALSAPELSQGRSDKIKTLLCDTYLHKTRDEYKRLVFMNLSIPYYNFHESRNSGHYPYAIVAQEQNVIVNLSSIWFKGLTRLKVDNDKLVRATVGPRSLDKLINLGYFDAVIFDTESLAAKNNSHVYKIYKQLLIEFFNKQDRPIYLL